jgi:hypothetical protein
MWLPGSVPTLSCPLKTVLHESNSKQQLIHTQSNNNRTGPQKPSSCYK